MTAIRDDLAAQLSRLTEDGGDDNRLVVASGPAWLLFAGRAGSAEVACEAAAAAYLPKDRRPGLEQVHLLRRAGFAKSPGSRNLRRTYTLNDDPSGGGHHPTLVADDALRVLREVYRCDLTAEPPSFRLRLGSVDQTENPALISAIRKLSKRRDSAARQAMYRQMVRATFLLPTTAEGGPREMGELMGFPVYGVFTDAAALRAWDPRVTDYERLHGRRLFPMMAKTGLGSLLINPKGSVGGELYRNEVEMLAAAIR